jgi:hypothetical protein
MSVHDSAQRRLRVTTLLGAFVFLACVTVHANATNLPEDAPIVVSESNSTRALVTLGRKREATQERVIPVGAVKVTVYVTNLADLLKGEDATAFRADIQDARYFRYPLEIVSLEPTRERPWVYALTFRLHAELVMSATPY